MATDKVFVEVAEATALLFRLHLALGICGTERNVTHIPKTSVTAYIILQIRLELKQNSELLL